jgi:hypothetical protein
MEVWKMPKELQIPGPRGYIKSRGKAQDQAPDLGRAVNVFRPTNVKNPFLEQSKPSQAPKTQVPAGGSEEQKK